MNDVIQAIIASIVITLPIALIVAFDDTPTVHQSWSTGKCVRVIEVDGTEKPCASDEMPKGSYYHVWVE